MFIIGFSKVNRVKYKLQEEMTNVSTGYGENPLRQA